LKYRKYANKNAVMSPNETVLASQRLASEAFNCEFMATPQVCTSPGYCRPLNGLASVIGIASYPYQIAILLDFAVKSACGSVSL
jgi:hypothetical protein